MTTKEKWNANVKKKCRKKFRRKSFMVLLKTSSKQKSLDSKRKASNRPSSSTKNYGRCSRKQRGKGKYLRRKSESRKLRVLFNS